MSGGRRIDPRPMQGVLELLPGAQLAFERMLDTIRNGFERHGFLPIRTPAIERLDVLLTKSGGDTEKQVYLVQSTGARDQARDPDLGLRFDLTVPLARYVSQHEGQLTFPFRRYQIQPVYRGERPQRGRYREFLQCDIDVVGRDELSPLHDAEVASTLIGIYRALEVGPFTMRISNRKLLGGLLEEFGVTGDQRAAVMREIDKLDKRGAEAVRETLAAGDFGLDATSAGRLMEFIETSGTPTEILERTRDAVSNPTYQAGHEELTAVVAALESLGTDPENYAVDLRIARGLDYYTGTVYETFLDDAPDLGSIGSGGRYDDLASLYTKSHLPGVGMSIGVTRLFSYLVEQGRLDDRATTARVLVTRQIEDDERGDLEIAGRLRRAGIPTEVVLEPWKFKKQMKHASKIGVAFVVVRGPSERDKGTVQLKNMESGEQRELALDALVEALEGNERE